MSEFVSNPLFGIALSILAYLGGMIIFRRYPHPLTTPLLLATFIYHYFSKTDWYFLMLPIIKVGSTSIT